MRVQVGADRIAMMKGGGAVVVDAASAVVRISVMVNAAEVVFEIQESLGVGSQLQIRCLAGDMTIAPRTANLIEIGENL